MNLFTHSKVSLAHLPTPLEYLPRITEALSGPAIYIKRDDCTGLATGGNKSRKLEYLIGDALDKKCTHVITQGAVQSNHARQVAAACRKFGMEPILVLSRTVGRRDDYYNHSGNVVLDNVLGATIQYAASKAESDDAAVRIAEKLKESGNNPYVIPVGGSNAVGSLGYVQAAFELYHQAMGQAVPVTHVFTASGSGGTQAGLAMGSHLLCQPFEIVGIGVSDTEPNLRNKVYQICAHIMDVIDPETTSPKIKLGSDDLIIDDRFLGDGYGIPSKECLEAIRLFAIHEGILLDPVYSGKAGAALIEWCRSGKLTKEDSVVLVHTGGVAGLFGYTEEWA